jgi:Cu(I)/Ag(I) efflux system periplasmic protein CusF
MNHHTYLVAGCAALALAGCTNDAAPNGSANEPMPSMPMPAPQAAALTEHTAQGTVTSIDTAAGTVTISHEAVASAGWPAMTMGFKLANPAAAASVTPGQRVEFRFTAEDATVTQIAAAQ